MDIHVRIVKWSQQRFGDASDVIARLAAELGVADGVIWEWIRKGDPPEMATLKRLAAALAVPVELLEKDFLDTKIGLHLRDDPFEQFRVSLIKSRPDPQTFDNEELALKLGDAWLDSSSIQIVRVPILHPVSTPVFSLNFDFPPQDFLPFLLVAATGERHFAVQIAGSWLESIARHGDYVLVCDVNTVPYNKLVLVQDDVSRQYCFGYLRSHDERIAFAPASKAQAESPADFGLAGRVVGIFRKPGE